MRAINLSLGVSATAVALLCGSGGSGLVASNTSASSGQAATSRDKFTVAAYLDGWASMDLDAMVRHQGQQVIVHHENGTYVTSRGTAVLGGRPVNGKNKVASLQYELFAERGHVFVISTGLEDGKEFGRLEAFRLADGKIVEMWTSGTTGARWGWQPSGGAGRTEETRSVLRRWYDEMYAQGRYLELAPQLCGPLFIRHELKGTFVSMVEEHTARLQEATGGAPRRFSYQAFAEGDKVGVIGHNHMTRGADGRGALVNWVQAFRVVGGKLVETWFSGFTVPGTVW